MGNKKYKFNEDMTLLWSHMNIHNAHKRVILPAKSQFAMDERVKLNFNWFYLFCLLCNWKLTLLSTCLIL